VTGFLLSDKVEIGLVSKNKKRRCVMDFSTIRSCEQFAALAHSVRRRRWYVEPTQAGVALAQIGPRGGFVDFEFASVPVTDQHPYSGVLAEIGRHRSGNAVYELEYCGIKDLEQFFSVYQEDAIEHSFIPKVGDFCTRALTSQRHKLLLIFLGPCDPDWHEYNLAGRKKVINRFLRHPRH
jgi:hypothetical protein